MHHEQTIHDKLIKLASINGIEIPDHVAAAVQRAPKGSHLNQWLERLFNDAAIVARGEVSS
jgi:hypothetical protein